MKGTFFLLFLFSVSMSCKAEYDILFCTNADSLGNCKGNGETFEWKGDRTTLEVIVMNKEKINSTKLLFKVFYMQNDREGALYAELSIKTTPSAFYAVKKIYFYKPGYYKVDVFDDTAKPLSSSFVTVLDRSD